MLHILNICTESNTAVTSYEKLLVINNIFKVLLNIHLFFVLISTLHSKNLRIEIMTKFISYFNAIFRPITLNSISESDHVEMCLKNARLTKPEIVSIWSTERRELPEKRLSIMVYKLEIEWFSNLTLLQLINSCFLCMKKWNRKQLTSGHTCKIHWWNTYNLSQHCPVTLILKDYFAELCSLEDWKIAFNPSHPNTS